MVLHPEVASLLDDLAAAGWRSLSSGSPAEARAQLDAFRRVDADGPRLERIEDHQVPGAGGPIQLRVYLPRRAPVATLVYFHGGGWVVGGIEASDLLARYLADATSAAVVSVDYRLAPEHRFPAAIDDAMVAVEWAAFWSERHLGSGSRLVVAGDSAGGNIATVVALQLAESGRSPVAAQILIYPVVDCDLSRSSYTTYGDVLTLSTEDMRWFWDQYVPDPASRTSPLAAPLRSPRLAALPPTFIASAECDALRDEGEEYALRLRVVGVPVRHQQYDGTVHGFFTMPQRLQTARDVLADCADFLRDLDHTKTALHAPERHEDSPGRHRGRPQ
jgi:acetyl esterase/lipase